MVLFMLEVLTAADVVFPLLVLLSGDFKSSDISFSIVLTVVKTVVVCVVLIGFLTLVTDI